MLSELHVPHHHNILPASQPDLSPELSALIRRTSATKHQQRIYLPRTDARVVQQHHNSCQKTAQSIRAALSQNSNTTAVKRPAHRVRTFTASGPALSKQTFTNTAAVTGHGYHRTRKETKEQGAPVR
jgi:hypothetical protein